MLRCDRVYEKNKQRLRLREAGYAGLSLLFSELHITPTLIRCLLNQVLHTGLLFFLHFRNVFYAAQYLFSQSDQYFVQINQTQLYVSRQAVDRNAPLSVIR